MTIAAEEPKEQRGRGRRRFFRAFLGCGLFVLVLVTIAAVLILPKTFDDPPYDASGLELVIPDILPEENAALAFRAAWEEVGPPDDFLFGKVGDTWWNEFLDGNFRELIESDPQIRQEYWEPILRVLSRLEESSRLPHFQLLISVSIDDLIDSSALIRGTGRGFAYRSQLLREDGDPQEILRALEGWGRVASLGSGGVQQTLDLCTSCAYSIRFADRTRDDLSATEGELEPLLAILGSFHHDRAQASASLRVEYQLFRSVLAKPEFTLMEEAGWTRRLLYLPNRTESIYAEHLRASIVEGERTGLVTQRLDIPLIDGTWDGLIHGNSLGWLLIRIASIDSRTAYHYIRRALEALRTTQLMVALVIYEEKHGELPIELGELVPSILPAVPLDPVDGRPLRFDRERRVVWAVGENGIDDGGLDLPGAENPSDIVVKIPNRGGR